MRITDAITQTGAAQQAQKSSGLKPAAKSPAEKAKVKDSVSISKEALSVSSSSEALKVQARVNALPEVRENRVAEVKARVQNGYYNTPEFREKLAEKLLNEFGLQE